MDKCGQITTIVKDHVQGLSVLETGKSLFDTPEVFLLSFTFPCEHRDAGGGDAIKKLDEASYTKIIETYAAAA